MPPAVTLLAGVSRTMITPPQGIFLIGYGDRSKGNLGVHDELTATALALTDGKTQVAIVALDLLTINEFIMDRVQARLTPTSVLLCCSHTHSGPIAYADEKSPRKNREYIDWLVEQIVEAVNEAQANLLPAHLEYASGEADVGINRRQQMPDGHMEIGRNPEGARDQSVQVVSVFVEQDAKAFDSPRPLAEGLGGRARLVTLVNYACHGTVLGPDNLLVSADWIGAMRRSVEADLGGLTLFLQGAAANINPDMYWGDGRAFDKVEEQGELVAKAVLSAITTGTEKNAPEPLKIEQIQAWLPTETPATSRHPPKNYARPLLDLSHLPGFMIFFTDLLLNQRYPWKPVIEARDGFWSVPMRLNAVRLGDLALVTYGAETFTEIGMKVKAASPAAHTLFASVSNGCISYLHTEDAHPEGGYEVDVAPLAYRYPGRLQAGCERIALETTSRMLRKLWS